MSSSSSDDESPDRPLSIRLRSLKQRERMSWVLIAVIGLLALSEPILMTMGVSYGTNPAVIAAVGTIIVGLLVSDWVMGAR